MGAVGTAAATKLALNQLIASLTVSAAFHNDVQAHAWQLFFRPNRLSGLLVPH